MEASPKTRIDLLLMGVRYVVPAVTMPKARGVPTGLAAAGPSDAVLVDATIKVWPSRLGATIGVGVTPQIATAPDIAFRDHAVYRLLVLADAVRAGDLRARSRA